MPKAKVFKIGNVAGRASVSIVATEKIKISRKKQSEYLFRFLIQHIPGGVYDYVKDMILFYEKNVNNLLDQRITMDKIIQMSIDSVDGE